MTGFPRAVLLSMLSVVISAGCAAQSPHAPAPDRPPTPRPDLNPSAVTSDDRPGPPEIILGTSVNGEPLKLFLFGGASAGNTPYTHTLILAAIHGDEPTAVYVGRKLVEYLRDHPEQVHGHPVGVIPLANPDGVATKTRANANGVDCNRNFPATNWRRTSRGRNNTGASPASEPETRAVIQAVALLRPARVVSIHSPLRCNNYDGPPSALALAQLMSAHNGYPVQATIGYATPGSFGSWAGTDRGIPVVTLELPPHTPGERAWQQNRDALLGAIRAPN